MSTKDSTEGPEKPVIDPATGEEIKTVADTSGAGGAEIEDAEIVSETLPDGDTLAAAPTQPDAAAAMDADSLGERMEADGSAVTEAEAVVPEAPETVVPEAPVEGPAPAAEPVPDLTSAPEPAAAAPAVAAAPVHSHGGGVLSTVFGGLLAAMVGFGAAQFLDLDWLRMTGVGRDPTAEALDAQRAELTALRDKLAEVEAAASDKSAVETTMTGIAGGVTERLGALSDTIGTLEGKVADQLAGVGGTLDTAKAAVDGVTAEIARVTEALGNVESRMAGVGDHLNGVEERLGAVDERLVAVEKRPLVESSDTAKAAFEVYERQLSDLRQTLEKQKATAAALEESLTGMKATAAAELTAMKDEAASQLSDAQARTEAAIKALHDEADAKVAAAETAAKDAEAAAAAKAEEAVAQAALSQVEAALNAGIPYAVALPGLAAVTEVPPVIAGNGDDGIPTLAELQESYTPLARQALDASVKTTMDDAPGGRIMAFLRTQTGARSLEPHEGTDPDAVQSRMSAAVEEGDLVTALQEYQALPEAGKDVLAGWAKDAQDRVDAEAALPGLAAAVKKN